MRHQCAVLIPAMLALAGTATVAAQERADDRGDIRSDNPGDPYARLVLAAGDRLFTDFQASVYAAVWNDPSFQDERAQFAAQMAGVKAMLGMDPLEIWRSCGPLDVVIDGIHPAIPESKPMFHLSCVAKQQPANLRALMLTQGKDATVPGADWAVIYPDAQGGTPTVAWFGNQLVLGVYEMPRRVPPTSDPATDLVMDVALGRLMAACAAAAQGDEARQLTALAQAPALAGQLHYEASHVPEGIQEKLVLPKVAGLKACDRAALEPLPASTLVAFAVGLDGPGMWQADRDQVLGAIAAKLSSADHAVSPAEAQAQCDGLLSMVGIPFSLGQLVQGFDGTLVIAIGQGMPVPSVTIALPRTAVTDHLLAIVLDKMHVKPPEEGSSVLVPIPNVPVSVNLVKSTGHWVLTSDASVMTGWGSHERGGWSESTAGRLALEKARPGAVAIGSSDTPTLLRLLASMGGPLLANADAQARQQGIAAVMRARPGREAGLPVGEQR